MLFYHRAMHKCFFITGQSTLEHMNKALCITFSYHRAIYFGTYAQCKRFYNSLLAPRSNLGNAAVHMCAAASAGTLTSESDSINIT